MQRRKIVIDRNKWARVVVGSPLKSECILRLGTRVTPQATTDEHGLPIFECVKLLRADGTQCCLGFICRDLLLAQGVAEDDINRLMLDASLPLDILRRAADEPELHKQAEHALLPLLRAGDDPTLCAVNTNDQQGMDDGAGSSCASPLPPPANVLEREKYLTGLFAKMGIDLEFVGEQDPHELPPVTAPESTQSPGTE